MTLIQDWWQAIAGSTVVATALSWFGYTVRQVHRIDRDKADRSELHRFMDLMEKREDQYRQDLERASDSRGKMHVKVDGVIDKLNETNVQLARLAGRLNGEAE